MSSSSPVRVSGPLVVYAAGFRADLEAQGYRRNAVANQLQLFAHVSRWLESKGLGPQHLTRKTAEVLRSWLKERSGPPSDPLFATSHGTSLSRYGVSAIVKRHAAAATTCCPSLATKSTTPHVLRHTACASCSPEWTPP
jgi:site-specific recombinase XerC